jgi:hypothetical protein
MAIYGVRAVSDTVGSRRLGMQDGPELAGVQMPSLNALAGDRCGFRPGDQDSGMMAIKIPA